jgi:hypothetical protein
MAITTAFPISAKKELFEARHNFLLSGGNTFKLALFTSGATLGAATTAYPAASPDYEVISTSSPENYTKGGGTLTRIDPATSSNSGIVDFADYVFSACSVTARGCMIYNSSYSNAAVYVGDFGSDKTSTNGTFSIVMPAAAAGTAILELA